MYRADPKEFLVARANKYELTYFLVDGPLANTYVLVSGVSRLGVEETAVFKCLDEKGNGIIWDALAEIEILDDETALNKLGYTARLDKLIK